MNVKVLTLFRISETMTKKNRLTVMKLFCCVPSNAKRNRNCQKVATIAPFSTMKQSFMHTANVGSQQIRMARAGLGLSIRDLAQRTGMNKATIVRLEAGMPVRPSTIDAIRIGLEAAGAEFLISQDQAKIAVSINPPAGQKVDDEL